MYLPDTSCVQPPCIQITNARSPHNNLKLLTTLLFVPQLLSDLHLQFKTFFKYVILCLEITGRTFVILCTNFPSHDCWFPVACYVNVPTTVYSLHPAPGDKTPSPPPDRSFTIDSPQGLPMGFYSILVFTYQVQIFIVGTTALAVASLLLLFFLASFPVIWKSLNTISTKLKRILAGSECQALCTKQFLVFMWRHVTTKST